MPPFRTYVVTQEREVKVSAESPTDAVRVGKAAFNKEDHTMDQIGGHVVREEREIEIRAREDF